LFRENTDGTLRFPFDFLKPPYVASPEEVKEVNDKNSRFKGRD